MKVSRILFAFFLSVLSLESSGLCFPPTVTSFINIQYNSVQVYYSCCYDGTYFLEYGLNGFTPGSTTTAGTGGTIVPVSSNPGSHVLNGLTSDLLYDVYIRLQCDTGGWTANSIVKTFRTAKQCNFAQLTTCGIDNQVVLPFGVGAWNPSCYGTSANGREKLYRYTAAISGYHTFYAGTSSGNTNRISFKYRSDTLPCNENLWNCLVTAPTGPPVTVAFGPLLAGKTYYILADAEKDTIVPDTAMFRIECPASCPAPTSINITSPSPGKIEVNYTGGTAIFEIGPVGFTPGTMYFPGTNGTNYTVISGSQITGLTPGTVYQGYFRSVCQQGNYTYYSANAGPYWFQVTPCRTAWTFDPANGPVPYWFNPWSSSSNNVYEGICFPIPASGDDDRFKFICPKTGNYTATFQGMIYSLYFGTKPFNAVCLPTAYNCVSLNWGSGSYSYAPLGILQKDSVYDFIIDTYDTTEAYFNFNIECNGPENLTTTNVYPYSLDVNWMCNCNDTVFLEIGPEGFTPGTGYSAGTNGTLVFTTDTSYSFTNLTPFTKYDIYLRTSCNTYFSTNRKLSIFTPKDCQLAPTVTCGDNVNHYFNSTLWFEPVGPWSVQACSGGNLEAEEHIYRFTPTQSGMYKILVYSLSTNWTGYAFTAKYFFKHDSLGCNQDNWNCIGQVVSTLPAFTPQMFTFGPLAAGETYYIMTDGLNWTYRYHTFYTRLLCPGVCSGPTLAAAYPVHPTGAVVYASCGSCFYSGILEVGPPGFTPGTGTQAGTNGTVYQNVTFPYTLNGLSPGVSYDIYARSDCSADTSGFSSGFSTNSGPVVVTPCSSTPGPITTSTNGAVICEGENITLYRNGGVAAPGTIYRWYENGCGFGNFLGTGDSILVSPLQTTTYYMRAEASCGNTVCVNKQVVVSNTEPVITGNTAFCPGNTTFLSTQIVYNQYLWNTGETTAGISVGIPGIYTVSVVDTNGCTVSSSVQISAIPFNLPQISGNLELCEGDSSVLFAGSGYTGYLWSDSSSSQVITVGDSGMYAVTVTNQFGCSGSDSVYVNLHSAPVVSISTSGSLSFCVGDSMLFNASPGMSGWQWYRNNMLIQGADAPQVWIKSAGNYFCIGSDAYECADTSNVLTAVTPCIHVGSPQDKINPDPTTFETFNVMLLSNPSEESPVIRIICDGVAQISIEVFDSMGRIVKASAELIHEQDYRLFVQGNPGMYIVRVRCGQEIRNLKMIRN